MLYDAPAKVKTWCNLYMHALCRFKETLVFSIQIVVVAVVCLTTAIEACHFLAWHLLLPKVITVFCDGDRFW